MGCMYSSAKVRPTSTDIFRELKIDIPKNFNKDSQISSEIVSRYIKRMSVS